MTKTTAESTGSAWRRMCGMALLWASLAALVHVATSDGKSSDTWVAIGGFITFVLGISWFTESLKLDLVDRIRSGWTGSQG